MKYLQKLNNFLANIETTLLVIILSTIILLAFAQVILRNFFATSFFGGDTLLRNLVLWIAFLGASLAAKEGKHINIDIFSRIFSLTFKKISALLTNLFATAVCFFLMKAAITFIAAEKAVFDDLQKSGMGDTLIGIPMWIFKLIIAIGFGLLMLRFFIHAFENIISLTSSKNEGAPS